MVSKAALSAVIVTSGLLAPGTSVLQMKSLAHGAPLPVPLLEVASASPRACGSVRQELRFEMLPRNAAAVPPPGVTPVCLAVYRISKDAALP